MKIVTMTSDRVCFIVEALIMFIKQVTRLVVY